MKLSLSKINFMNIVTIILIFSSILSVVIYNSTDTFYEEKVIQLEKNYYNKNKVLIKNEVQRVISKIKIIQNTMYKTNQPFNEEKLIELQKTIFLTFKDDRFGDKHYGYFWLLGLDKKMKMHPTLNEVNINYLRTIDDKNLFDLIKKQVLNKNGGYIKYKWINPDTGNETTKTSYVQMLPELNLIIGTGFYLDQLKIRLESEKEVLKTLSSNYLTKIYITLFCLIVFTFVMARYLSSKIKKIEEEKEEETYLLEQYRNLLDESSVVSRTDKNGVIIYVNNSFEKVSGYSKEEIIGKTHALFKHPDTPKNQFQNLWHTISNGDIWKGILKNRRKNGESYYASVTIIPIKNKENKILRYISSSIDITKHIENKSKLKNLFKTDTLTGLGNRVSLLNYITKNNNVTLSLITIDRFKEINDSFSHGIGDNVIKEFGNRLYNHFNDKSYFLFRVQADIFAIVNNSESSNIIKINIRKFMNTVGKRKYDIDKENFFITYTCGIASNQKNLFAYADIALNEAKQKKQRIIEYDTTLKNLDHYKNNILWVDRLHKAINEDKVIPHFQPIFNYKTEKIEKYEALMRISENDLIIYPNEFLDIAKKTKFYPELTNKMIIKVLEKFSKNNLEFSINLCIEDLMNDELMTFLYDYAKKKNVFKRMVLEIVESEEMEDNEHITVVIQKFKKMGTKLAIDDFGSGYSNYEYLITLQADYLKIDGSITKLITTDTRTLDVVKSIVEFAKKSNIKTIVEFVSDEEIDKILRDIGVDYAQGFYYGKPQAELV